MRDVKKFLGLYAYGTSQEFLAWSMRYVFRPPEKLICKLEPGREAEVARSVKTSSGLYVYGTFNESF